VTSGPQQHAGDRRPQALVVEDDGLIGLMIESLLGELGCAVSLVATGEEALELAQARPPDLVLMDVGLRGELDGIETAKRIRAGCPCPIVFMTGASDPDVNARMKQIAGSAVLGKPLAEPIFRLTVRDMLRG
jgi:1,2-diacylglycerol 3-beta-glucosyltransferase